MLRWFLATVMALLSADAVNATACNWSDSAGGGPQRGVPKTGSLRFVANAGSYTEVISTSVMIHSLTVGGLQTPALMLDRNPISAVAKGIIQSDAQLIGNSHHRRVRHSRHAPAALLATVLLHAQG